MRIIRKSYSNEYHYPVVSEIFEIDDDELIALIDKILMKTCTTCKGKLPETLRDVCNICYGTGKIRKYS